jgi:hypothetical protein
MRDAVESPALKNLGTTFDGGGTYVRPRLPRSCALAGVRESPSLVVIQHPRGWDGRRQLDEGSCFRLTRNQARQNFKTALCRHLSFPAFRDYARLFGTSSCT